MLLNLIFAALLAAAHAQQSSKSTGNPSGCAAGTQYFTQLVDHFDTDQSKPNVTGLHITRDYISEPNNKTFLQQYEIIDHYYKPGGPVMFYQGAEAPLLCLEHGSLLEYAKELGALVVALEHRYFGSSCPYGLNYSEINTWTPSELKALTLDNVLHDSIRFLTWLKESDPRIKDAKVLADGGSYGAILVALLRIWFPDMIYGSLASSIPTYAFATDPNDETVFGWADWANAMYYDASITAASKIRAAMDEIRGRLQSGQFDGLEQQLHLCSAPNSTVQSYDVLRRIADSYVRNVQYNVESYNYPFDRTINATLESNASMAIIGAAMQITIDWLDVPCLDWVPQYKTGDPFLYLRCTCVPTFDTFSAPRSIWGGLLPDYSQRHLLDPYCTKSFGFQSVDGGEPLTRRLGLDDSTLQATERLLMTEGLLDPVTYFGPRFAYRPGHTAEASRVLYIDRAGHTADGVKAADSDSEGLKNARAAVLNTLKAWLGRQA